VDLSTHRSKGLLNIIVEDFSMCDLNQILVGDNLINHMKIMPRHVVLCSCYFPQAFHKTCHVEH